MSKQVTVEELREKLEELLAEVEKGESVTVTRDGRAVWSIGPTFVHRGVPFPFRDFDPGPPLNLPFDVVDMLVEDREYERKKYRA